MVNPISNTLKEVLPYATGALACSAIVALAGHVYKIQLTRLQHKQEIERKILAHQMGFLQEHRSSQRGFLLCGVITEVILILFSSLSQAKLAFCWIPLSSSVTMISLVVVGAMILNECVHARTLPLEKVK